MSLFSTCQWTSTHAFVLVPADVSFISLLKLFRPFCAHDSDAAAPSEVTAVPEHKTDIAVPAVQHQEVHHKGKRSSVKISLADLDLPEDAKKEFDVDGDGTVNVTELIAYVNQHKALKKSHGFVMKAFFAVIILMILFLLICLGATVVAIQITKEMTVSSSGALTAVSTSCADGAETCEKPLSTGPTKRDSQKLTSTMPEKVFEELKSLTLQLPHQNGELVSVTLDVSSFERRMVPTSRCGSVVDLETIHGSIMLDDTELLVTEEFVLKMNSRGYDLQEDVPLAVDGGRRLSVGSDIAGMFNFIAEYEYKCQSQVKPLRKLDPPFSFSIDTYQMCEGPTCYSEVEALTGNESNRSMIKLPGFAKDPHAMEQFVKGNFIKAREEVYAMGADRILTVQEWPNFPLMSLISLHDFAAGMFSQKQVFNESHPTYCSTRESKDEENQMANMADFVISAVGTTSYPSDPDLKFNRYILYHREHPDKEEAYVEFWEEVETGMPHKYFLPNMEDSPRAYFTSFRNLTQDEFDAIENRLLQLDCHGPQVYGLTTPVMDEDFATPADENISNLEFYRSLNEVCLQEGCSLRLSEEDAAYWELVFSVDSLGNTSDTEESEDDADDDLDNGTSNATGRRLASKPGVCLKQCQSLINAGYTYKRGTSQNKDFFGVVKYASDFGTFTTSGKVPSSYASFSGSAGGGIAYNIPPIYIRIYARGTAKGEVLAFWDGKTYSAYSGSVTIGFEGGLNILIGKITVAIEGTVSFQSAASASYTPAMDVKGSIRGEVTIEVLGGLFTAKAYVSLQAQFWNLGPTFNGADDDDDEFAVTGKAGFEATVFWFFKVRFSTRMDIVKRRKLWSNKNLIGDQDPSQIGPNCHKISDHDRKCKGTVGFQGFYPVDDRYPYDDEKNLAWQNSGTYWKYDKSTGSQVFRSVYADTFRKGSWGRDNAPKSVKWYCSDERRRRRNKQYQDWGFRRRDGRRRWDSYAMANRFVVFGDGEKIGLVAYNCQY
ncbi:unnamed protein product [Symbiodinium natans]|uniref:EF-hand domain-containing protein n=1 Tax=Symbiodinium natans TaxID=878477 RepID=A0A812I2Z4_9DINO|nr:unnamed protein product [Symbiodinium natans]